MSRITAINLARCTPDRPAECHPLAREGRASSAFTLIELLVVIATIAILAAILVPVASGMKASAKQTACASNMRQIGMGLVAYCTENGGNFPETAHTEEERSWIYTLSPYLGNVDEVRICPADPAAERRREAKGTSYVLNEYIAVPLVDPFGRVKESFGNIRALPFPARTITLFIGADGLDVGVSSDHTHSRNWKGWSQVLADIQPDRHRPGAPAADRTRGSANYLFADGHVEAIDAARVKRAIERKINIATVPQNATDNIIP